MDASENIELPSIEFRNVSLSFDGKPVLTDISFRLEQGEMIFLTGISGSGKSVLLRLAIGLLKPDTGQIFIDGREIEMLEESELLAIRGGLMGMVFQEDSLFTGLTVYENAAYRLEEHGWTSMQLESGSRGSVCWLQGEGKLRRAVGGSEATARDCTRANRVAKIMLFDDHTRALIRLRQPGTRSSLRARDINHIRHYVKKKS